MRCYRVEIMDLDELEVQYREAMHDVLNQMQTVVLLLAQAETKAVAIGDKIQSISSMVETFIAKQRQQSPETVSGVPLERLAALQASERELQEVLSKFKV
jgi:hypothetical protein